MRMHPLHLSELGRRSHDHVFHNLAAAWINLFSTRTRTLELNRCWLGVHSPPASGTNPCAHACLTHSTRQTHTHSIASVLSGR